MTRPRPALRLVLACVLGLASAGRALAALPATFVPPSGVPVAVAAADADGRTFVSVGDVAAVLGGTLAFEAATGSFELKIGPHTAVFGTETAIAVVDTKLVPLAGPSPTPTSSRASSHPSSA